MAFAFGSEILEGLSLAAGEYLPEEMALLKVEEKL